jgi:putative component of toxin-antitoxin plasmid stabilization module
MMMTENTCMPPTPEQRRFLEIREAAERRMLDTVFKAISDAAAEVENGIRDARLDFEPTHQDYFTFTVQQFAFVRLCGGSPETLQGGDPELGERILSNGRHIIDSYWRGEKKS